MTHKSNAHRFSSCRKWDAFWKFTHTTISELKNAPLSAVLSYTTYINYIYIRIQYAACSIFCILFMFQITAGNKFLVIKRLSTVVVDAAVAFIK